MLNGNFLITLFVLSHCDFGLQHSGFLPRECLAGLKITDSRSPVMMTGQIIFWPDKPGFGRSNNEYNNFFLPCMEYQITLAIDRCTALTFRFFAASWWNSFTSCWVPLRGFPPLSCPFIYTLTLSIIVLRCLKSPSPIAAYRWKLIFFVARQVIESLLH